MTTTIEKTIAAIAEIRDNINRIDNDTNTVRNNSEFDRLQGEKLVALYDLESQIAELASSVRIAREIHDEFMSADANEYALNIFKKRIKK